MTEKLRNNDHDDGGSPSLYESHQSKIWSTFQTTEMEEYEPSKRVFESFDKVINNRRKAKWIYMSKNNKKDVDKPKKINYMQKADKMLEDFDKENTPELIQEKAARLPYFETIHEAIKKAAVGVIKSFTNNGIVTYIGQVKKEALAILIPWQNEEEKKNHKSMEGDYLWIENRLHTDIFINRQRLNKNKIKMGETPIRYMTKNDKIIKGKIIKYGEDDKKSEVVFQQEQGSSFAINVYTLEAGIQRAISKEELMKTIIQEPKKTEIKEINNKKNKKIFVPKNQKTDRLSPKLQEAEKVMRFNGREHVKRDGWTAAPEYNYETEKPTLKDTTPPVKKPEAKKNQKPIIRKIHSHRQGGKNKLRAKVA